MSAFVLSRGKAIQRQVLAAFFRRCWILYLNMTVSQRAACHYQHDKRTKQLSSSFFAHLTVQNDDVGVKSMSIKCSLTLKTHVEEKREKHLQC